MPNNNNKKSFLLNLEKTIDTISTEVKNSLKLVQSDGPNSLDWLKKSMHPYFFAAFEDETEAVGNPSEETIYFDKDLSWELEVKKFIDCILNDKQVTECNSNDAYNAMELVHRCYQDSGFPIYQKEDS